jgi:hypothetical protein
MSDKQYNLHVLLLHAFDAAFQRKYPNQSYIMMHGYRAPKHIVGWYFEGTDDVGRDLVQIWEGSEVKLSLTDSQLQGLIQALRSGQVTMISIW